MGPSADEGPSTKKQREEECDMIVGRDTCTLISQGAEARLWATAFCQRPTVIKERFKKRYRHPDLDSTLREARLKQEVRSMARARKLGVPAPVVYWVEFETSSIYMEHIAGHSLKRLLHEGTLDAEATARTMADVGRVLAVMHDGGLIHGDLTTSNMMVREGDGAVVLIDYGLSQNSTAPEDKAVDLYVLERALSSAHAAQEGLFDQILREYKRLSRQWCGTLNRFAEVRQRGRKRAMLG